MIQITNRNINDLKMYKNNPRDNSMAIAYVKKSIEEFGFQVPLIITKDNEIICGHTRYQAAKELNLKDLPCIIVDDLSEEQIRAFRIIDNKTHEFSSWNMELLLDELKEVDNLFTGINFDENLDKALSLLDDLKEIEEQEKDDSGKDEDDLLSITFVINSLKTAEKVYEILSNELKHSEIIKRW